MDEIDMGTIRELRNILGIAGEMIDDLCYKNDAKDQSLKPPNRTTTANNKPRRARRFKVSGGGSGLETDSLIITRRADGSAVVQIDEGSKITLSRALAELLLILSDDAGPSDDALVAWKSLDEIGHRLSVKRGKKVRRKTVSQSIYRLRIKLDESRKGDWRFVLTDVEAGARFALRR